MTNLQNITVSSRWTDGGQTRHNDMSSALDAALADARHPNAVNSQYQTQIWADRPLDTTMDVALATMTGHRFCVATINHRGTVGWHKDAIRPCAGCTHNEPDRCPVATTGHDMNGMEWNGLCAYLPE